MAATVDHVPNIDLSPTTTPTFLDSDVPLSADHRFRKMPPEICGYIADHLSIDGAFGTCASLNEASRAVHWATLPGLFHTVDWTMKLPAFDKSSNGDSEVEKEAVDTWCRKAKAWLSACATSPGGKYLRFLKIPCNTEPVSAELRTLIQKQPNLKAITTFQLQNTGKLSIEITICAGFLFGSLDRSQITLDNYPTSPYDANPSSTRRVQKLQLSIHLGDFPPIAAVYLDATPIIRNYEQSGAVGGFGKEGFERRIKLEGFFDAERKAFEKALGQEEDSEFLFVELLPDV